MVSTRTGLLQTMTPMDHKAIFQDVSLTSFDRVKRSAASRRLPGHPKPPSSDEEVAAEMAGSLRSRRPLTKLRRRRKLVCQI